MTGARTGGTAPPSRMKAALAALLAATALIGGLRMAGPSGDGARADCPTTVLLPLPNKGGSDWGYAWVPIVGPLVGGALAGGLYNLAFA